ncbi:MAG: zonular occludens toxin domain-containing protein [Bifidobacteriaceae bacterium]|nr:zonular occludens toxin domain-containing protein [Bifidobacteriaceae bacterium]
MAHENVWRYQADDLLDLPPGKIFIDEAHLWFPARAALRLPPSWLAMLSQTRKSGWDLYWATQHETRVDRVVRDVTSWMHLCTAWWKRSDGRPLLFHVETWEPEDFRKKGRRVTAVWKTFKRDVAQAYDTYEHLEIAGHAESDSDVYRAKSNQRRKKKAEGAKE